MYPSSAHSFGPIGMKLGIDTPWDPGSGMGQERLHFSASFGLCAKHELLHRGMIFFFFAFLCISEHFKSIETLLLLFLLIFMTTKRARAKQARCEREATQPSLRALSAKPEPWSESTQNVRAKPEVVKRSSSPALLALRWQGHLGAGTKMLKTLNTKLFNIER